MIRKKRKIAYILAFAMLILALSGCGKKQEVPELLEPSFNNESYRPVEKGLVGNQVVKMADVMPEEYPAFYTEGAMVESICVDIGDYVEAGTVVAKMDTEELIAKRDNLNQSIASLDKSYTYGKEIKAYEIEILKYQLQDAKAEGDNDTINEINTQIDITNENLRYDELLYKHQKAALSKDVKELNDAISNSTLVADHAGYVTYIKDLGDDRYAEACENIVVISDTNDLHIELSISEGDKAMEDLKRNGYDRAYVNTPNGEVDIVQKAYTNEEKAVMFRTKKYPLVRFEPNEKVNLTLGEKLPVYYTNSSNKVCLRVGADSLYTEGTENFVYVKTPEGKEKRTVTVGDKSKFYIEIVDGLSEGELVYYSSNSIMPENYEEFEVTTVDYQPNSKNIDIRCFSKYTKIYRYKVSMDAKVNSVMVSSNDEVKKGDLLCTLNSKEGSALELQMQKEMANMTKSISESERAYEENLKKLDAEIKTERDRRNGVVELANANRDADALADVSSDETSTDANQEAIDEKPSATYLEQLCLRREILVKSHELEKYSMQNSYNQLSKNYNDTIKKYGTNGSMKIYASSDGMVGGVVIYEGKEVKAEFDGTLLDVYEGDSFKYCFNPTNGDYLGIGNTVTLSNEEGDTYQEKVIGGCGKFDKYYISKKGDKYYSSFCLTENLTYISHDTVPEDKNANSYLVTYPRAKVSNVVVVPLSYVYYETEIYNPGVTYTYVWKLVDGSIVKQYISFDEDLAGNEVWVLDGLTAGDVIIREKVGE